MAWVAWAAWTSRFAVLAVSEPGVLSWQRETAFLNPSPVVRTARHQKGADSAQPKSRAYRALENKEYEVLQAELDALVAELVATY